jgi:hypothetical protein
MPGYVALATRRKMKRVVVRLHLEQSLLHQQVQQAQVTLKGVQPLKTNLVAKPSVGDLRTD